MGPCIVAVMPVMNYQIPQNNPQMINDVQQYRLDLYGEAVRVATQLQQTCLPNQIHVSMSVHVQCYQKFEFEQTMVLADKTPSYLVKSIKDLQKRGKNDHQADEEYDEDEMGEAAHHDASA